MILHECRYYEWKKDASKKQPYYIHFKDSRPLLFAALYDSWKSSEGQFTDCFFMCLKRDGYDGQDGNVNGKILKQLPLADISSGIKTQVHQ